MVQTQAVLLLAATLFAHEPAAFREHSSAGLYDHGGPLGRVHEHFQSRVSSAAAFFAQASSTRSFVV